MYFAIIIDRPAYFLKHFFGEQMTILITIAIKKAFNNVPLGRFRGMIKFKLVHFKRSSGVYTEYIFTAVLSEGEAGGGAVTWSHFKNTFGRQRPHSNFKSQCYFQYHIPQKLVNSMLY